MIRNSKNTNQYITKTLLCLCFFFGIVNSYAGVWEKTYDYLSYFINFQANEYSQDIEIAKEDAWEADRLGDKWYQKGSVEKALELYIIAGSAHSWGISSILEKFLKDRRFIDSEEFVNRVLESWSEKSNEIINSNLEYLLQIATRTNNEYYYHILKRKAQEALSEGESLGYSLVVDNYEAYFKNLSLASTDNCKTIVDFLLSKIYIDPELIEKYDIELISFKKIFEGFLYDILKTNDLTFKILHAIALHAMEDPYFRLDCFSQTVQKRLFSAGGAYLSQFKRVSIYCKNSKVHNTQEFMGTIIHEWTHQLMAIIYNNSCNPYFNNDTLRAVEFNDVCENIETMIANRYGYTQEELKKKDLKFESQNKNFDYLVRKILHRVKSSYEKEYHHAEYVVCLPELQVHGFDKDLEIQDAVQKLSDFWNRYLIPDINQFIESRTDSNYFVSDAFNSSFLEKNYVSTLLDPYKSDIYDGKKEVLSLPISADEWYEKGDIERAIEFDKLFTKELPLLSSMIKNKWDERGHPEIANLF